VEVSGHGDLAPIVVVSIEIDGRFVWTVYRYSWSRARKEEGVQADCWLARLEERYDFDKPLIEGPPRPIGDGRSTE
jgi:hypothetical protein